MRPAYPCPACSAEDWEPIAEHAYERPPGDTSTWDGAVAARRATVLHDLWFGGADAVVLTSQLCRACGLVAYRPRPSAADVEAKYTFLEREEGGSGAMRDVEAVVRGERRRAQRTHAAVVRELGRAPRCVLDYGGGDGKLMPPFLADGADCYLLDYNERPIAGVERLGVGIEALPEGMTFDAIVCSHVLEHLADPREALAALAERLTDDGVLYVEVPDEVWRGVPMRDPVTHVSFFTEGSLRALLRAAGLRVEDFRRGPGSYGARRKRVLLAVCRKGQPARGAEPGGDARETRTLLGPSLAARFGRAVRDRLPLAAVLAILLLGMGGCGSSSDEVPEPRTLGSGVWSYFADPRGVYAAGRTFVGWADDQGYTQLAVLARDGRVLERRRLGPRLPPDDHNNPALHFDQRGRLSVFYSAHNGSALYYRTSARPHTLASLSDPRVIPRNTPGPGGFTYPNPLRVGGRLWLFFRGGNSQPSFTVDRGGWIAPRTVAVGARRPGGHHVPGVKYASEGRAVHMAMTAGKPDAYPSGIYYARIEGRALRAASGRFLARLGSAPPVERLDLVRSSGGLDHWAQDVALDGSGNPVIVYQRRTPAVGYWYARFDGRRWRNHLIARYGAPAPPPGAVGGISLDHEDPSTVYLARVARAGEGHEVEMWRTPDGGRMWRRHVVSASPGEDDLRPFSPRGLPGSGQVLWFSGERAHWTTFNTDVRLGAPR